MNENSKNTPKPNSESKENQPDHKSSDYVDMVLSRKGAKVVDSETLIKETQKGNTTRQELVSMIPIL